MAIILNFKRNVPCTIRNYDLLSDMNSDTTLLSSDIGKLAYVYEDSNYYYLDNVVEGSPGTWVVYNINTHGNFILNMSGQMGIFRAGGRVAFWDSANSISWSDLYNKMDFEPSLKTRAGNSTFSGILGRIVNVLPQGDGFVIYSTKNIVGVRFINDTASLWDAKTINDTAGIAYPRQVCVGTSDTDHYAYTNIGFLAIGRFNPMTGRNDTQIIIPDVYDLLKESNEPVYLDFINGRYLFISTISPSYITGDLHTSIEGVASLTLKTLYNDNSGLGLSILPSTIPAEHLSDRIRQSVEAGITAGTYYRWTATYRRLDIQETTYLSPLTRDDIGGLVPNTGVTVQPSITPSMAEAILRGDMTYVPPSLVGDTVVLPWDMTTQGIPDGYLNILMSMQNQEWNLRAQIAAADRNLLQSMQVNVDGTDTIASVLSKYYLVHSTASTIMAHENDLKNLNNWVVSTIRMAYIGPTTDINTVLTQSDPTIKHATLQGAKLTVVRRGGTIEFPVSTSISNNALFPGTSATIVEKTPTYNNGVYDIEEIDTYYFSSTAEPFVIRWGTDYTGFAHNFLNYAYGFVPSKESYTVTLPRSSPDGLVTIDAQVIVTYNKDTDDYTYHLTGTFATSVDSVSIDTELILTPIPSREYAGYHTNFRLYYQQDSSSTFKVYFAGVPVGFAYKLAGLKRVSSTRHLSTQQSGFSTSNEASFTAHQSSLDWGIASLPQAATLTDPPITVSGLNFSSPYRLSPYASITYPGASFLLQDGSIAPIYPQFSGAVVLDTHLKKLGKYKGNFNLLLELSPINSDAPSTIPYTNFGMTAGILAPDLTIRAFTANPTDSRIRYGKFGLYRLGMTKLEEVRFINRLPTTCTVTAESSHNGKEISLMSVKYENFTSVPNGVLYTNQTGRWHTVTISGIYDLTGLEIRGNISGRR